MAALRRPRTRPPPVQVQRVTRHRKSESNAWNRLIIEKYFSVNRRHCRSSEGCSPPASALLHNGLIWRAGSRASRRAQDPLISGAGSAGAHRRLCPDHDRTGCRERREQDDRGPLRQDCAPCGIAAAPPWHTDAIGAPPPRSHRLRIGPRPGASQSSPRRGGRPRGSARTSPGTGARTAPDRKSRSDRRCRRSRHRGWCAAHRAPRSAGFRG